MQRRSRATVRKLKVRYLCLLCTISAITRFRMLCTFNKNLKPQNALMCMRWQAQGRAAAIDAYLIGIPHMQIHAIIHSLVSQIR